jgi:hypothetical protein
MKQTLFRAILALLLGWGLVATFVSADPIKGEKILNRAIHDDCAWPAPRIALMHSQKEWDAIFKAGKMEEEVAKLCKHKAPLKPFSTKYAKDVFEFLEHYANDSGAVPA